MREKIEINRNGNNIEITPDFEKRTIKTDVNGKIYHGLKLNDKNQFLSKVQKIGVQLDEQQAEAIRTWIETFKEQQQKENEEKLREIKNKPVETLSFKYGNYLMDKYTHTESVFVDGKAVYSDEGYEIMEMVQRLGHEDLDKLGIERREGIWQEIKLTTKMKKFIMEQGAINEAEVKKEMEKIEEKRRERKEAQELEAEAKKAEMLKKAKATGEKQIFKTQSVLLDDGNLLFKYTWVHPDGSISTSEFYDGD